MHRLCASHGLMPVGSATLPEMFLELLDPDRRSVVLAATDPGLRQVLFSLAIHQSFRRDLFVRGVRAPAPSWRRRTLAACRVSLGEQELEAAESFPSTLGTLQLPHGFCSGLGQLLKGGPLTLADLEALSGEAMERLLPALAVLAQHGAVRMVLDPGSSGRADPAAVTAFNSELIARFTEGRDTLGLLLSPLVHQPVPITLLEAFFLQVTALPLADQEVAALVSMGMGMAGATLSDADGRPFATPAEAEPQLLASWRSFQQSRLPQLVRLGVAAPPP
jgi:hypothetical protein